MRSFDDSLNDWMDARVEAYLDGVLPDDERLRFERGLAAEAEWEAEVFLADRIRQGLRALPDPECPPHVAAAVLAQVRQEQRASWMAQLKAWLQQQVTALWQPALAMTMVLLLVVSAALIGRSETEENFAGNVPPSSEVQQALAEVQWTLGYLSGVSRQTGRVVRDEVITDHVVSPVQEALGVGSHQPDRNQR